jgi:hypothetical protein
MPVILVNQVVDEKRIKKEEKTLGVTDPLPPLKYVTLNVFYSALLCPC